MNDDVKAQIDYPKMAPALKAQWVQALRSRTYQQGRRALRDPRVPDRYCCLGVLCDLQPGEWVANPAGWYRQLPDGPSLTPDSLAVPGLTRSYGAPNSDAADALIAMNDGGADFAAIADWIEANL